MRRIGLCSLIFVLVALMYPVGRMFGQAVYGSIIGTVTDSSGAAVPNAKVTITDVAKGVNYETTSNESGNYQQTHLIVGTYNVKVEAQGFQAYVQDNVQVQVDAATQVNAVMQLGQVTQTVEVTAAVPLLKTERTDVAQTFTEKQVQDLPIFNRNFTAFELLTPGTQRLGWQHAASENPQGSIQIMVNGQHFSGTDYQLDGTSNQDPILGIIVINPNLDSVTEAKITTQNYDAEFGQATAGVVTSQTKSGSNDLHGDGFWFNRVNATSARDPFSQCGAACGGVSNVPHSVWNQFGGSLGGPIKKDKIFIFGDFQGTRRSLGGSGHTWVPTAAERLGDLSAIPVHIYNPFGPGGTILAPDQRVQFPGNVIPTALLSTPAATAALKMLQNIPLPNATPASPTDDNFFASGTQTFNSDGFDVRTDWYTTEKLHMLGRYSFQRFARQGAGLFGAEVGGPNFNVDPSLGGFSGQSSVRNQSIAYGFDYTLKTNWLTDFRFGFMRYRVFVNPNGLGTSPATDAGIPGLNLDKTFTSGMPHFQLQSVQGSENLDWGYSLGVNQCNCPLNEQEQQFQFVNNWTNIRGNHTIKFGTDLRYAMNLRVPSDSHRSGEIYFSPNFTEGPSGVAHSAGLGLATYMLGYVSSFSRYVSKVTDAAERQKRFFFYGQDTWRVTPKFTVNYGLRWEIYYPQTVNGKGNGGWVQPATGEVWIAGENGIGLNGNVDNSYTNLAPRLGIAYQVDPKTVIRMGYGRSFDIGTFGSIFGHTVTQNLPVLANQSLNPPQNYEAVFALNQGPTPLDPATILQNNCNAITLLTAAKVNGNQCLGVTGNPLYPDGVSPHMHPKKMRMLTVDAWNVTVQRAFSNTLSAEIAYVANKGTHDFNGDGPNYDINTPIITGFAQGVSTNLRRPYYLKYGWTQGLNYYGNDASNNYESLQAKVDKRFGSGYQISGNYTFAHANQYDGNGYFIYQPSLSYGPSDFQRRHVLTITNVVTLPVGRGHKYMSNASRVADLLLGGWQLNGTWTAQSGVPFTPGYNEAGQDRDTGENFPSRSGSIGAGTRRGNPENPGYWYQTTPLDASGKPEPLATNGETLGPWTRPAKGTFGNAGVDSLWGPRFFDADLSLFKNFHVTEKVTAQIRAESYNTFNHVNLALPDGCVDCSTAGRINEILSNANMREWQFGLRIEF